MEIVTMVIQQVLSSPDFEQKLQACLDRALEKKMDEFLRRTEVNSAQIHDIEGAMEASANESKTIQEKIASLEERCDRALKELNQQEQYSRRNCLRIFGIEEKPNENTDEIVLETASKQLGLLLQPTEIDRSHRIGKPEPNKSIPIIAKFCSNETRSLVMKNRRKLKGTHIVVREDLTQPNQELLQATKAHPLVKSAWFHDGKIIALLSKEDTQYTKRIWGHNDLQHL